MNSVFQKIDIDKTELKNIYTKGSGVYKRTVAEHDKIYDVDPNKVMLQIIVRIAKGEKENDCN